MNEWQAGDVEVNKLRLHYTRTGGDRPPLVLAHGITDDGLCWTPVAQALAPEYDVVMVDARGHGRSDAPRRGYGPTRHAKDLAGVIAKLRLDQPIVLGHSMGATAALALAGAYPHIPRAILLEDPPPVWMPQLAGASEARPGRSHLHLWMASVKRKTREELIAGQRAATPDWSEAELGAWADAKHRFSPNVIAALDSRTDTRVDWPALLRRITCPALLITADLAQGAVVTAASAAALQSLIPQLEIAHIPAAGHSIRRDQLDRYLQVIRVFLARITDERLAD
ncbi:MAG: alpha/beta hydrolase [Anaerolineae bacterium]